VQTVLEEFCFSLFLGAPLCFFYLFWWKRREKIRLFDIFFALFLPSKQRERERKMKRGSFLPSKKWLLEEKKKVVVKMMCSRLARERVCNNNDVHFFLFLFFFSSLKY